MLMNTMLSQLSNVDKQCCHNNKQLIQWTFKFEILIVNEDNITRKPMACRGLYLNIYGYTCLGMNWSLQSENYP